MVSAYLGFLHANQPNHTPQVQGSFQQKLFPVGYEKPNLDQLKPYQASTAPMDYLSLLGEYKTEQKLTISPNQGFSAHQPAIIWVYIYVCMYVYMCVH